MAGTELQITAAAPAPEASAPSAPAASKATGNKTSPKSSPTAPAPKQSPTAKAKPVSQAAPAPEGAKDTSAETDAEFHRLVSEIEGEQEKVQEGNAEKTGKEKATPVKGADQDKAKDKAEKDPIQEELDAAAAAEGLKVAEDPEEKAKAKTEEKAADETEEVEPPDAEADGDAFDSWVKTLSKPAQKKITQQRNAIGKLKATAAQAIVLQPTISDPLSHVTTLEQLEDVKSHYTDLRNQIRSGGVVKVLDGNGKKLELDPEVEEDATKIEGYLRWAETALDAVPDAKERLKSRESSKPWESAEKLAPGLISDKDSFARKKALEILKQAPSLARLPDYEVRLAHMVRSMQMDEDAKATDAYPKGKAKWVRLPLDKEGNVVSPKKKAVASQDAGKKGAPIATDSRPLVVSKGTSENAEEAYKRLEQSGSDEDLRAALVLDLGKRAAA